MDEVEQKAKDVLAGAHTLFLSTCADNTPWVAGGFFAESDAFTLVMVLEAQGTTLTNIRANPQVAVVVSSGNAFEPFLQAAADVEIVEDEAGMEEIKTALRAKAPEIEPILGAPIRGIRLRVRAWKVTDIVNGWLPAKVITASTSV